MIGEAMIKNETVTIDLNANFQSAPQEEVLNLNLSLRFCVKRKDLPPKKGTRVTPQSISNKEKTWVAMETIKTMIDGEQQMILPSSSTKIQHKSLADLRQRKRKSQPFS